MDLDIEELGKLLSAQGSGEESLEGSEYADYIIHLASCGIENLVREGVLLKDERASILEQTQSLVSSNYKTFIHTADCSRDIYKEFTNVENHLDNLLSSLPTLKSRVEEFLSSSRNLSNSRHTASLTLSKHTQLLEILELPQLMDTCVRNGYYDDALEILSYARRLEKKHSDVPVIASIVSDVKSGNHMMLLQLLSQLRSSVTLPNCLKIVGLLRRLDIFTELELRLKFLQARDFWFTGMIKAIPKDDPYRHISNVVETSRVHLFDIVTQYRAIFSDDDTRSGIVDNNINEQALFHGWILHKVNQFLNILEIDLNRGIGQNIESLLAQCMFFGQSFSRIGADFRTLLIPIFQRAVYSQFESDVRLANLKFDESFSSFSLMDVFHLDPSCTFLMETQDKTSPSLSLMEFPPLAHYLNGLVNAFNGLRQCCPLGLVPRIISLLASSISKVITALSDLHQLESTGFTSNEKKTFERMCNMVANTLVPHINSCIQLLFPLQTVSSLSGLSTTQLQKQKFGHLPMEDMLKPLQPFIIESVPQIEVLQELEKEEEKTPEDLVKSEVNKLEKENNYDDDGGIEINFSSAAKENLDPPQILEES